MSATNKEILSIYIIDLYAVDQKKVLKQAGVVHEIKSQ